MPTDDIKPISARIALAMLKWFYCFLTDLPASKLSNHCFPSLGSDDEPVTESHCNCISSHVGWKWKNILRNLGLAEVHIEHVDADYKDGNVYEKCYQGLLKWMRSCSTQTATTKQLCDALRQTGCIEALEELSKAGINIKSSNISWWT